MLHQFCVFYTGHEESILREHFGVPQLQIHCALYLKVSDFLTVFTHGFFFSRHPSVLPACAAVRATNGSIDYVEAGKVPANLPVVRSIMGAPSTLMLYMCLHTNHVELIYLSTGVRLRFPCRSQEEPMQWSPFERIMRLYCLACLIQDLAGTARASFRVQRGAMRGGTKQTSDPPTLNVHGVPTPSRKWLRKAAVT